MTPGLSLILVVDDNDAARFVKVQVMRRAGFDVVEASTGLEALQLARSQQFDLAIVDVNLPDIHGFEVCQRLKQEVVDPPAMPVLQVSNTAVTDADRVRGLQLGADVYLIEPVAPDVLVATVQALLRVRRSELALAEALDRERASRRDADEANRLKDNFLATLSHELRTPLHAMTGWLSLLQRDDLTPPLRVRAIESLLRNTRLQTQLINDLLDVSRIAKGKLVLDRQPIDLATVVESAVETMRDAALAKRIELVVVTQRAVVEADAARMHQVIGNLIANAIQFTPEGGRIHISLAREGLQTVARVADTGVGIDPDFLPHVFDQFRQAESTAERRHGGLGLGLAIVRQLVELHGGTVTAESAGPMQGSVFTVRLPAVGDEPVTIDAARTTLAGAHVLVIDDDPDVLASLAAALEEAGARVSATASPAEAVALAARTSCDVAIADADLGQEDAGKLIARLRERDADLPALAVTSRPGRDDHDRLRAAGFDDVLDKPVVSVRLVGAVVSALGRGHLPPR
jgi:signal transduction histidine kinase